MAKIPQMVYFNDDVFITLYQYMKETHAGNISQALNQLIPEYQRFKHIALKLQEEMNKKDKGEKKK